MPIIGPVIAATDIWYDPQGLTKDDPSYRQIHIPRGGEVPAELYSRPTLETYWQRGIFVDSGAHPEVAAYQAVVAAPDPIISTPSQALEAVEASQNAPSKANATQEPREAPVVESTTEHPPVDPGAPVSPPSEGIAPASVEPIKE
ncbi:MAG: hypothetical protein KGL39_58580 [Patescibacteria group bacterium]|nr:hypothetical protein [Patescibacteria group bacterium]